MARADRIVRQYLRTRFLFTTKAGSTYDGLLLDADANTVVLAEVESIGAGGDRTTVAGQVFIPRADIAYMQRTS